MAEAKVKFLETTEDTFKKLASVEERTFYKTESSLYIGKKKLTNEDSIEKNQGASNAGKILTVGEDGNVTPTILDVSGGEQSDWNETDEASLAFIKNKPIAKKEFTYVLKFDGKSVDLGKRINILGADDFVRKVSDKIIEKDMLIGAKFLRFSEGIITPIASLTEDNIEDKGDVIFISIADLDYPGSMTRAAAIVLQTLPNGVTPGIYLTFLVYSLFMASSGPMLDVSKDSGYIITNERSFLTTSWDTIVGRPFGNITHDISLDMSDLEGRDVVNMDTGSVMGVINFYKISDLVPKIDDISPCGLMFEYGDSTASFGFLKDSDMFDIDPNMPERQTVNNPISPLSENSYVLTLNLDIDNLKADLPVAVCFDTKETVELEFMGSPFKITPPSTGIYIMDLRNFESNIKSIRMTWNQTKKIPTTYLPMEEIKAAGSGSVNYYGVCDTDQFDPNKVVTVDSSFILKEGAEVKVIFSMGPNYAEAPTLNVNGTGAKAICKWKYPLYDVYYGMYPYIDDQKIYTFIYLPDANEGDGGWEMLTEPINAKIVSFKIGDYQYGELLFNDPNYQEIALDIWMLKYQLGLLDTYNTVAQNTANIDYLSMMAGVDLPELPNKQVQEEEGVKNNE